MWNCVPSTSSTLGTRDLDLISGILHRSNSISRWIIGVHLWGMTWVKVYDKSMEAYGKKIPRRDLSVSM